MHTWVMCTRVPLRSEGNTCLKLEPNLDSSRETRTVFAVPRQRQQQCACRCRGLWGRCGPGTCPYHRAVRYWVFDPAASPVVDPRSSHTDPTDVLVGGACESNGCQALGLVHTSRWPRPYGLQNEVVVAGAQSSVSRTVRCAPDGALSHN